MIYTFEDYELDMQVYELRRAGMPCKLEPQAFNVLVYLLQHGDRVVTKEELLEHLWPDRCVGEATLSQRLMEARKAIGDNGRTQRILKTIRGRGYRFVATVESHAGPRSADVTPCLSRPAANVVEASPNQPVRLPSTTEEAAPRRQMGHQARMPEAPLCPGCGTHLEDTCAHYYGHGVQRQTTFRPAWDSSHQSEAQSSPAVLDAAASPTAVCASEQEYKHVTVLCCALSTIPARPAELEAETIHALMHTLLTQAQNAVQRYAGTITQWRGDGFTALFGAPVAYEDHAWRAVLAACELREHLRQPITRAGQAVPTTLPVTMGLHTGAVIVGRLEPTAPHLYTATGATMHLAARLQQRADPGMLLISDTTYRRVQAAVQVSPWGTLDEQTIATPCPVYTVQGVMRQHTVMPERRRRQLSRFLGRERELAILQAHLDQVRDGQGQVVHIVGEAGIGKSRLYREFHCQRRGHETRSYVGRCLSYGSPMPYLPVVGILRDICGISDTDRAAVMGRKLHRCLETVGMASDEWAPYLHQVLGLSEGTERLAVLSPEAIKRQTFAALRQLVVLLSQQQPLMITVEDAHWIDKTSEAFFSMLVESLARVPVLLLITYRPGYRPPWLDKSYVSQLALPPLPRHESQRLLESRVPKHVMSPAILQTLLAKAEGNPFFLEELSSAMLEQADSPAGQPLPDTIQGVLMARMDRLSEPTRRLLQMASILGRVVSVNLLSALWEGPGDLQAHLATLQHLEFLYEQVGVEEPQCIFKHALTQEVAYTSMLYTRRQRLHATVAQTLEARYAGQLDDVLEQLAYHYGRSADAAKAVTYLRQFGAKAASCAAHMEAVSAYQQALRHIEHLPTEQQERSRLDLLLCQAFSLSILGRFGEILALLSPHQERLERLQEPSLCGPYYFRLGMTAIYLGTFDQAIQYAQRALAAACQCQDVATQGMAYHLLAWANTSLGRYRQGRAYGHQAVALLNATGEPHWLGLAYWDVGMSAAFLGEFATALEALSQTRALGEASGDRRLQHFAESCIGWVHILRGEWEAAIEVCQGVVAHAPDPIAELSALQYLGMAYLERGDPGQAVAVLEQVVRRFHQVQLRPAEGRTLATLGEALLADNQIERAQHMARQGLEICQEISYPYGVGIAQRTLGRIAQASGDDPAAAHYLDNALRTFTFLQTRYDIARTHLCLAELAHTQSDLEALTRHLSTAHHLFQELHVPHYVAQTEHLATRLRGHKAMPQVYSISRRP